ncbi:BON domain-containing protein [Aeoliella straminimaris]|nr:BON domain-containing protein [Aeoliella straminimaris]
MQSQTAITSLSSLLGDAVHPGLSGVSCQIDANMVVLRGEVPTFYLKQLAQETASRAAGVEKVNNEIEVHAKPRDWVQE